MLMTLSLLTESRSNTVAFHSFIISYSSSDPPAHEEEQKENSSLLMNIEHLKTLIVEPISTIYLLYLLLLRWLIYRLL